MPKRTVLDLVNSVLNEYVGETVSSINDTDEAYQLALMLQDLYYSFVETNELPHEKTLFQLTALGSTATPTKMLIPETIREVEWIKYDCREASGDPVDYKTINYLPPSEFVTRQNMLDASDSTVDTTTENSVTVLIRNDKSPEYYTSFDDVYVIFDAYDSTLESTLQTSKTQCYGSKEKTITITDTSIPDLPSEVFPQFLAEFKARASIKTIQQVDNSQVIEGRKYAIKRKADGGRVGDNYYGRNDWGR